MPHFCVQCRQIRFHFAKVQVSMDWDDLRIFLQLSRARQMTGAAKALGLDDSTIARRVARLEKTLGVPLVERAGRRTVITQHGEKLARAIEELESIVLRKIVGLGENELAIAGRVRVGAPEGFGVGYLARKLAEMSASNTRLEIELVALPRSYSLAAREVDIAITLDRPSAGQAMIQKLTDYTLELYGTASYFERNGKPGVMKELQQHIFVGYIPELLFTKELNFSKLNDGIEVVPIIRSTSVIAQVNAVLSGAAIGVLPRFLADAYDTLQPLFEDEFQIVRSYWISVHDDMRQLPRIQAVFKAIAAMVRNDRSSFVPR